MKSATARQHPPAQSIEAYNRFDRFHIATRQKEEEEDDDDDDSLETQCRLLLLLLLLNGRRNCRFSRFAVVALLSCRLHLYNGRRWGGNGPLIDCINYTYLPCSLLVAAPAAI